VIESMAADRRRPWLAGLMVAALPWLLFWRLFAPLPEDRAHIVEGDLSSQYYPLRAYAARRLAQGQLPLWSPDVFGGQPALADIQSAALYPPNVIWSLTRGGDLALVDLELQAVLHLSLAALGAYRLGRRLTGSTLAGLVTGSAFGLGGYLTSFPVQQLTILSTVAWLPWLLLAIDRFLDTGRGLRWQAAAISALVALTVLAGHPQTAMLCAYTAAGYTSWLWYWRRPARVRLLSLGAAAALGVGLTAVQLLPTLEFIRLSVRSSLGFGQSGGGFGLHELSGLLYPGYFGGTPQYAGVVTLLLAIWAAATVAWRKIGYWLALGLAGTLVSFGDATFVGPLTYLLLPGFATSRNQERAVLWLAFSLAVLAGVGAAQLARSAADDPRAARARRALHWALLSCALVAGLLLAGTRLTPPSGGINLFGGFLKQHVWLTATVGLVSLWWGWQARRLISARHLVTALALLLVFNLASVGGRYHLGEASPAVEQPGAPVAATLRAQLQPGERVASGGLLPEGPNAGLLFGFADTSGNTPLRLQAYAELQASVPEWVRWQLLAVSHVLLPAGVEPGPGLALAQAGDPSLFRLTIPVAPVRLVHSVARASGPDVWDVLSATGHDPATTAVIDRAAVLDVQPAQGTDSTTSLTWEPERIAATIAAGSPVLAVFSQAAYPGWRATVDGRSTDWVTADGLLIGVPVPAGTHAVELRYQPSSLRLGAAVSIVSVLLLVLSQFAGRRPRQGEGAA